MYISLVNQPYFSFAGACFSFAKLAGLQDYMYG